MLQELMKMVVVGILEMVEDLLALFLIIILYKKK